MIISSTRFAKPTFIGSKRFSPRRDFATITRSPRPRNARSMSLRIADMSNRLPCSETSRFVSNDPREKLAPGLPPGIDDPTTAAFQTPEDERTFTETRLVFEALAKDKRVKIDALLAEMEPLNRSARYEVLAALESLRKTAPKPLPTARNRRNSASRAADILSEARRLRLQRA